MNILYFINYCVAKQNKIGLILNGFLIKSPTRSLWRKEGRANASHGQWKQYMFIIFFSIFDS